MNATGAFTFPALNSFPFYPPDPTSSWLDSCHGASGLQPTNVERSVRENMPPSQSGILLGGSKRKADLDENISGPSLKKSRFPAIGQEPFQTQAMMPQESRAGFELAHHIPSHEPRSGLNGAHSACVPAQIPPEIAGIHVQLDGLISRPVESSDKSLACGSSLTTGILRGDVPRIENRFYPYLWFPECTPYMLRKEEYNNIFPKGHVDAMQNLLQRLGLACGKIGLTATGERVLLFEPKDANVIGEALKKRMGPSFDNARWQGAMIIPQENHAVMRHHIQRQRGPDPNALQSSTCQSGHQTGQLPQGGPSSHYLPDNLTSAHQTHPVQNNDPFVLVSNDSAKRRRNGHSPGLSQTPDSPQAVPGPSTYPSSTVFAETHTKESFPHPQNKNAAVAPKRKNRRRAPAKSSEKDQGITTPTQQSQLECEEEITQQPKTQRGKRRSKKDQDSEYSQIQAEPSRSQEPETQARETQPLHSVSPQFSTIIPHEDIQTSGSYHQQQVELGYSGNVKERAPFNGVATAHASISLATDQPVLAIQGYTDYHGDMAGQAIASPEIDQLRSAGTLGADYAPLDCGGYYKFRSANTAPTSMQQSQLDLGREVAQMPKPQHRKRRSEQAQAPDPSQIQPGPSGSTVSQPQAREIESSYSVSRPAVNTIYPQENTRTSGSYIQHHTGYADNVEESAPESGVTSQTPFSLPADQLALINAAAKQLEGYNGDMSSVLAFGSANTFGGGCYTPPDFGGHYQLTNADTSQSPFLNTPDQTGYTDLTPHSSSMNQGGFPNFATGYETGGATTSQNSVSQPSDQVVDVDAADLSEFAKILAMFTGKHAETSYPNIPACSDTQFGPGQSDSNFGFGNGHNQPRSSSVEFDANTCNSFQQPFCLPSQDSVPSFSGPSAGAWSFDGL